MPLVRRIIRGSAAADGATEPELPRAEIWRLRGERQLGLVDLDDNRLDGVIARTFIEAVNDGRHDDAAALLAEDVELVFPGARLRGREVWLESRRRQSPPEHVREEITVDELRETPDGADVSGRLIQRWVESGEVAGEVPVRIVLTVADGLIERLELSPVEGV